MRECKFIRLAVILVMISTIALTQDKAPDQGAPSVKHYKYFAYVGQRDV
jgi:hypothetical protein